MLAKSVPDLRRIAPRGGAYALGRLGDWEVTAPGGIVYGGVSLAELNGTAAGSGLRVEAGVPFWRALNSDDFRTDAVRQR